VAPGKASEKHSITRAKSEFAGRVIFNEQLTRPRRHRPNVLRDQRAAAFPCSAGEETRPSGYDSAVNALAHNQKWFNVHSLDRSRKTMIKMGNAGKTPADCARYCVSQRGGKFVLQTKTDVYKLNNQDLAEKSAGQKVKITGTLDETQTNTIFVHKIEALPEK
jgi:Protein of unknown function (DUF5818)